MKKIIIRLVIVVILLLIVAVFAAGFFLDSGIKRAVEYVGPKVTKVEVKLNSVSLSLFSGSGKVKDLIVGNPAGYKSPSAISVGSASLDLNPKSIFSDKVVIKSINVQAPEITLETDITSSNLKKIMNNIDETTGGSSKAPSPTKEPSAPSSGPSKKLQVDDFVVNGGKIHVTVTALGQNYTGTAPLPQIHMTNLGTGPDGITAAELTKLFLNEVCSAAEKEGLKVAQDLMKGGQYFGSGTNTVNSLKDASKGIGDIFKKK